MVKSLKRKLSKRKRKGKRKTKVNRKKFIGGSFIEAGSMASYFFNKGINTFTIPSPTMVSGDPRITTQFI